MARHDTDLPFGDAFSPAQLHTDDDRPELAAVLEMAKEYEGREDAFDEAIREAFFPDDDDTTRAKNVRLGMKDRGYKITDDEFYFTELGDELYDLRDDPDALYDRFAQYILRDLHGLKGIEVVEDLEAEGRKTVNDNIKEEFKKQYDFHIDETSNHWSQMRAWMSEAGVVNKGTHRYDIDRTRIEELIGVDSEDIVELDGLNEQQQAFLRSLALIDPPGEVKSRTVKRIAEHAYGVNISQSNISRRTLDPLEEAGYIQWEHVSGKPNLIETTDKFDAEVLKPVLDDLSERVGVPRHVLRLSFEEIMEELDSDSTHEKGIALETLTVKTGRLLGLDFVGWRVRGRKTGGSEVDIVMDEIDTTFNRWQIQCKNTKSQLGAKQVSREVGISRIIQTNTILMIARGGVSQDARQYANQVMRHENLAIMFLEGDDIEELDENTDHLLTVLRGEARRIHNIKRLDRREVEQEDGMDLIDREDEALEEFEDELDFEQEQPSLNDFTPDEDESSKN
ncbi:restriction endonuclease [Halosimplex rubrum]|uniref:Restriction endonuclease n=1 Tax=Halosimplex rubrum TaxID=869889 RepID=A0A7D5P5C5_9EURY|nr:restriction endonuclease [Halosimplex rubrum]QLH78005.1 restriction endonuclease [Halosimplex rubrum]